MEVPSGLDFPQLIEALERNDPLFTSVDLAGVRLVDGQVQKLAAALSTNNMVTSLNLAGCSVKDSGARLLSNVIRNNHTLQQIFLSDNSITDEGSRLFCDAMQFQSSIVYLDMSYNDITSEGSRHLNMMLRSNTTLTTLLLGCNQLGNEGARAVCHGIKANPDTVLHDLYLDNNGITDASDLADLLKTVPSVTNLELQDNRLGDAGAKELTEAIKVSRLGSLNLANNNITDDGLCLLSIGIAMNRDTLKKARAAGAAAGGADAAQIDLRRNKIQQRGEKALQGAQMRKPGAMVIWRDDQIIPESAQDGGDDSDSETEFAPIPGADWIPRDPARRLAAVLAPPQDVDLNTDTFIAATDSYVQLLQQATGQFRRDAQQDDLPLVMVSLLADIPKLVAFMLEAPPAVASPGAPALGVRFGIRRARAALLLVQCAELRIDAFDAALAVAAVQHVVRAFFAFPFNNILHALAPRLLAPILSGESPILAEALMKADILDLLIDAVEKSRDAPVRPGHLGHVVQIANSLIGAEVPAVRAAIEAHPRWADFARGDLAELNKRNATLIGGVPPQRPPMVEGGEARSMLGLSNLFQALGLNLGFGRG